MLQRQIPWQRSTGAKLPSGHFIRLRVRPVLQRLEIGWEAHESTKEMIARRRSAWYLQPTILLELPRRAIDSAERIDSRVIGQAPHHLGIVLCIPPAAGVRISHPKTGRPRDRVVAAFGRTAQRLLADDRGKPRPECGGLALPERADAGLNPVAPAPQGSA